MATTESQTQDLLGRARAALQQGDKATARDLLLDLLENDDRNAKGWLLLSGAVDAVEEQRICLENVLTLEPDNNAARQGLDFLNRMHPPAAAAPSGLTSLTSPVASTPEPAPGLPMRPAGAMYPTPEAASPPPTFPGVEPFDYSAAVGSVPASGSLTEWANNLPTAELDQTSWGSGAGGFAEQPAPMMPAHDDPWAALRANIQSQTENVAPTLQPPSPDPIAPAPAATPMGAGSAPAEVRFSEEAFAGSRPSVPPAQPAPASPAAPVSNLPEWAISLDSGAAAQQTMPAVEETSFSGWPMPDQSSIPQPAPAPAYPSWPPAEDAGKDGLGEHAAETALAFGAVQALEPASPGSTNDLDAGALPPDSPWAGTFGGGLGVGAMAVAGAEAVPAQRPFGETGGPGFEYGPGGADLGGSSPSIISRPPIAGRGAGATPTFPCPNCGELSSGNALSCARCQYRFYAACQNCGEYVDTSDPSPVGGDTCPRCGEGIDKLALGRNEAEGRRGMSARESIVASIPHTRQAAEKAAEVSIKDYRSQSALRTLIGLLVVVALVIFLLYVLPQIMQNAGISFDSDLFPRAVPTP